MTDELDALRATRSHVHPPSPTARQAARARWEDMPLELAAVERGHAAHGVKTFTARMAIAGVLAAAIVATVVLVTRERIDSVKPKHVLSITPLPASAATDPQVFLLVGSDSRAFVHSAGDQQQFGAPGATSGERSDTLVLVRIDPNTRRVLVVSIPRDLWVDIPGCGMSRINAAFDSEMACGDAHGGAQLLIDTIERNLGVPINHVMEVQFPQFAALVNRLGGLRIDFPLPTRDRYTGLSVPAGCAVLDGEQALAFVRSRHYEYNANGQWQTDPTSDLGRIERQQLALRQLAAAAESSVGTDPRPLLRSLFDDVTVDPGFTSDDALRYFTALRSGHPTIAMTLPVHPDTAGDHLLLDSGAQQVLDALSGRGSPVDPASPQPGATSPTVEPTGC